MRCKCTFWPYFSGVSLSSKASRAKQTERRMQKASGRSSLHTYQGLSSTIPPTLHADCRIEMYIRVIHHFFRQFLAEPNRAYSFIAISVPQIQSFRKFIPKLMFLQAKNKLKQPNTADQPILAAPQPSRAELEHPQFWSDFSEILDSRSWKTFKTAGSVWFCLKKWWNTLI